MNKKINKEIKLTKEQKLKLDQLGRHSILEFYGCDKDVISSSALVEKIMINAAKKAKATIVGKKFKYFEPWGVSGVVIIAESHLTIHTWPEYQYAAIDVYTCGDIDRLMAVQYLKDQFKPTEVETNELVRGTITKARKIIDMQSKKTATKAKK